MDPRDFNFLVVGTSAGFRTRAVDGLRAHGCTFVDELPLHAALIERTQPGLGDLDVLLFELASEDPDALRLLRRILDGPFSGDLVLALGPDTVLSNDALRTVFHGRPRKRATIGLWPTNAEIDHLLTSDLQGGSRRRAVPARAGEAPPTAVGKGCALLAVPDPFMARRLAAELHRLGHVCEHTSDEAHAFRLWRAGGHVLLLATCDDAAVDGYRLVRRIRDAEHGTGDHLPSVGFATRPDRRRARDAGLDICLPSSWSPWEFAACVETLRDWAEHRAIGTAGRTTAAAVSTDRGPSREE